MSTQANDPSVTDTIRSLYGADAFYDAGNKGCGDGPLDDIAMLFRKMLPGKTVEIRATEPTVAVDLPAWCRLTGNTMIQHEDDRYLVRRKG